MTLNLYKIKEWFKSLFKKKTLTLNEGTNLEYNIEKSIEDKIISQKNNFKQELRTVEIEEEKKLIKKFESGELLFSEITEDIINKINKGYSLQIKRNMEKISKVKLESN